MKKFLISLMLAASAMTVVVVEADAKRLGGGGSFGRQSQSMGRQATPPSSNQPATANQAQPGTPAAGQPATAARPASPWRNILGGALLGLGLGALLSQLGLSGAMASIISTILTVALIALVIMFLVRLFRGKSAANRPQPAFAGGYGGNGRDTGPTPLARTPEIGSRLETGARPATFQNQGAAAGSVAATSMSVPADFDVPGFLRHAKTYFIRLQAAWDRADINDIREFTTTEMFGELRLQLQERGPSPNHTDVVTLDAELLGLEKTAEEYLASVRFSGMIRESENAPAEQFAEIWNLIKPATGSGGWVLAGIQQLS